MLRLVRLANVNLIKYNRGVGQLKYTLALTIFFLIEYNRRVDQLTSLRIES